MGLMAIFLGSALLDAVLVVLLLRSLSARRRRVAEATERAVLSAQLIVAKDLHDGPLQFLAGLALRLNILQAAIHEHAALPANVDADLDQLLADIRMEQRDLRGTIETLSGREDEAPPEPSCAAILALLASRWRLDTELSPSNADDLIPPDLARDVNFILKEAASNAARHGSASRFIVTVQRTPRTLELEIVDNGSGMQMREGPDGNMDEEARPPTGIEWRVRKRGGRLGLETQSTGTRLSISLPVSR